MLEIDLLSKYYTPDECIAAMPDPASDKGPLRERDGVWISSTGALKIPAVRTIWSTV